MTELRRAFTDEAKKLGRRAAADDYIRVKENMHKAYVRLGNMLFDLKLRDLSLRVFIELERTVTDCRRIKQSVSTNF